MHMILINEEFLEVAIESWPVYMYILHKYIKLRVHGVKTYAINGKKALTGDWEELNNETYVCLKNNSRVYFCT